jgi:hypothetical protein
MQFSLVDRSKWSKIRDNTCSRSCVIVYFHVLFSNDLRSEVRQNPEQIVMYEEEISRLWVASVIMAILIAIVLLCLLFGAIVDLGSIKASKAAELFKKGEAIKTRRKQNED